MLHGFLPYFLFRTLWFEFINWYLNIIFSVFSTQITHYLDPSFIFHNLKINQVLFELHKLHLKLFIKQYLKYDLLHWIVAPHLSGGRPNNYSSKQGSLAMPMSIECYLFGVVYDLTPKLSKFLMFSFQINKKEKNHTSWRNSRNAQSLDDVFALL